MRKNNTPDQKAKWQANKHIGSRFIYVGTATNGFNFPKRTYDELGRRLT